MNEIKTSSIEVLILFDNVSSDSAPIIKSKIYSKINQKLLKLFQKKTSSQCEWFINAEINFTARHA